MYYIHQLINKQQMNSEIKMEQLLNDEQPDVMRARYRQMNQHINVMKGHLTRHEVTPMQYIDVIKYFVPLNCY